MLLKTERKKNKQATALAASEAQKSKDLATKLATDYILKDKALQQINAANSKADAISKTVAKLEAELKTERNKKDQAGYYHCNGRPACKLLSRGH